MNTSNDRRTFLGAAAATLAAVGFGSSGPTHAQAEQTKGIAGGSMKPKTLASFETLTQIDAGVLNVGYAEAGPKDGTAVLLLHGWPYDIHSFVEVAPLLAAAGYRVIVPYLRGFGTTQFLSKNTPRNGQQSALAVDCIALLDALSIRSAIIAGFDWGARCADIVAALWPERCKALVSVSGYLIGSQEANKAPLPPKGELEWWYQYYFATERGRAGYEKYRRDFAKLIWKSASPRWAFDDAELDRSAAAFDNPDHVAIVIHNYRWRLGLAEGESRYDDLERRLSVRPVISVPTITLEGDANGAPHPESASYADRFAGKTHTDSTPAALDTILLRKPHRLSPPQSSTLIAFDRRGLNEIRHARIECVSRSGILQTHKGANMPTQPNSHPMSPPSRWIAGRDPSNSGVPRTHFVRESDSPGPEMLVQNAAKRSKLCPCADEWRIGVEDADFAVEHSNMHLPDESTFDLGKESKMSFSSPLRNRAFAWLFGTAAFGAALLLVMSFKSATNAPHVPSIVQGGPGAAYSNMPAIAPIGVRIGKYMDVPESSKGPPIDPAKGYRIQELGGDLYMVTEGVHQCMFLVHETGVIVVDAPPTFAAHIRQAIDEVTTKPITHVVYSHSHIDHIGGTRELGGHPIIVAHEETKRLLVRANDPNRPLPTVTFGDRYRLEVGGKVLELSYHGNGHEPGNIFIYAPAQRTLMVVDVVFPGWMPWRRFAVAQDVQGYFAQVEEIAKMDFDTIVTGHVARTGTKADVEVQLEFLKDLKTTVADALKTTKTGEEMDPADLSNPWALYDSYIDHVVIKSVNALTPRWSKRLAAFDVYIWDQCYAMEQSLRIE